jgi:hypothetical protein
VTFHDNLKTQAAALVGQSGITAADVTSITSDNTEVHNKISDVNAADAAKKAKVATKNTTVRGVSDRTRAFANRVKADSGYTVAIGQQLGIIGEEDTTDLNQSHPGLTRSALAMAGNVQIDFNKTVSDGVEVYSKRGSETEFSFLALDTQPPYVDTRPNLGPGPETRQYRSRYVLNDAPIGNWSDVLTVTVPG